MMWAPINVVCIDVYIERVFPYGVSGIQWSTGNPQFCSMRVVLSKYEYLKGISSVGMIA